MSWLAGGTTAFREGSMREVRQQRNHQGAGVVGVEGVLDVVGAKQGVNTEMRSETENVVGEEGRVILIYFHPTHVDLQDTKRIKRRWWSCCSGIYLGTVSSPHRVSVVITGQVTLSFVVEIMPSSSAGQSTVRPMNHRKSDNQCFRLLPHANYDLFSSKGKNAVRRGKWRW